MAVTSSDCSSAANQSQNLVPAEDTSRNRHYPSAVSSSALLADLRVGSWIELENLETSGRQHSIELVCQAGALTSVGRTIVAMIFAEGSAGGSRVGDSFLEARGGVVRFCGGGFLMGDWEDVIRD
jgi:hypothetical protein